MSAPASPLAPSAPAPVGFQPNAMDDYEALVANMRPPTAEEAAAASAILEAQMAEPAPLTAPVTLHTPPVAAPAAPAAAAPAAAPAEDPTAEVAEGEDPAAAAAPGEPKLANNWRVSAGGNPLTQRTLEIYKEHQASGIAILLSDAETMARKEKGLAPITGISPAAGVATGTPAAVPGAEALPGDETQQGEDPLATRQSDLEAQMAQAQDDFDQEKQAEIQKQLNAVQAERIAAKVRADVLAELHQEKATAAFETAQKASQQAVKAMYGEHWTPDSPLTLMMLGMHASLVEKNDQSLEDPNLPLILAQKAAAKLGLQPATQPSSPAAPATAPTAVSPVSAPQAAPRSTPQVAPPIAPGSARSSDPGATALQTPVDLEDYYRLYGVPQV